MWVREVTPGPHLQNTLVFTFSLVSSSQPHTQVCAWSSCVCSRCVRALGVCVLQVCACSSCVCSKCVRALGVCALVACELQVRACSRRTRALCVLQVCVCSSCVRSLGVCMPCVWVTSLVHRACSSASDTHSSGFPHFPLKPCSGVTVHQLSKSSQCLYVTRYVEQKQVMLQQEQREQRSLLERQLFRFLSPRTHRWCGPPGVVDT